MTTFNPVEQRSELLQRLEGAPELIITCYCAAWCTTCKAYQPAFDQLAARYPAYCFVWLDIEDHEELLEDEDIENFPTLHIQQGESTVFFGTLLPYIEHLEQLIQRAARNELPVIESAMTALQQRLSQA